jgi:hypothetical protein
MHRSWLAPIWFGTMATIVVTGVSCLIASEGFREAGHAGAAHFWMRNGWIGLVAGLVGIAIGVAALWFTKSNQTPEAVDAGTMRRDDSPPWSPNVRFLLNGGDLINAGRLEIGDGVEIDTGGGKVENTTTGRIIVVALHPMASGDRQELELRILAWDVNSPHIELYSLDSVHRAVARIAFKGELLNHTGAEILVRRHGMAGRTNLPLGEPCLSCQFACRVANSSDGSPPLARARRSTCGLKTTSTNRISPPCRGSNALSSSWSAWGTRKSSVRWRRSRRQDGSGPAPVTR